MNDIKKRPLADILKEVITPDVWPEPSNELIAAVDGLPYFTALDWFHLSGRGDVAVVTLDRDCLRSELLTLFARVQIDDSEYIVKGVESFTVEQQRKGWTIGLLVDGQRKISGERI